MISSNNNFLEFSLNKPEFPIISGNFQIFPFKNRYVHDKKLIFNQDKQSIVFNTVQMLRFTKIKKIPDFLIYPGKILYFTRKFHQNPPVNAESCRELILLHKKKRTLKSSFTFILIYYLITSNISLDSTTLSEILKALKAFSIDSRVFLPLVWI